MREKEVLLAAALREKELMLVAAAQMASKDKESLLLAVAAREQGLLRELVDGEVAQREPLVELDLHPIELLGDEADVLDGEGAGGVGHDGIVRK